MSKGWSGGSTRAWRRVRAAVLATNLAENNGRCTLQIPTICTGTADTGHHIHGIEITGNDPRFVVASCAACNLHIGHPPSHDPLCELCAQRPANVLDPEPRPATRW